MNRSVWAAVAAGLVATAADTRADYGGPPPAPPGGYQQQSGPAPAPTGMYGPNPFFNSLAFWKKKAVTGGHHGGAGGKMIGSVYDIPKAAAQPGGQFGPGGPGLGGPPGAALPGTPGNQMPGTLVFPFNPYTRSPRDYFMYEPGGR